MRVAMNSDVIAGPTKPRVVIIGGGLAGMSAAEALGRVSNGRLDIALLEAKRTTGGRAGSFLDAKSGESVDYCQHVAMSCCTNLIALLGRCRMLDDWQRYDQLHFHHPNHPASIFSPSRWLPAPLHLAAAVSRLNYLTAAQKREVRSGFWKLMRTTTESLGTQTAKKWLCSIGQSETTIDAFWDVILVSALGEETSVVSMRAARKVLIDGFAAAKGASDVLVPRRSLSDVFGVELPNKIVKLGPSIRRQTPVTRIRLKSVEGAQVELASGECIDADHVVVAIPWHRVASLFERSDGEKAIKDLHQLEQIKASPITGLHLWFDQPLLDRPHAVMVGTTSQWIFQHPHNGNEVSSEDLARQSGEHYHQVVVSASRTSLAMSKELLLETILGELRAEFPQAAQAKLLRHRFVTDPQSVFSVSPKIEAIRQSIRPALPCIHLAGDWTDTGWPATMESASHQRSDRCWKRLESLGTRRRCSYGDRR